MVIAALGLGAAMPARAQTFDLAAGAQTRVELVAARAPGAGETATLAVDLDPRGLEPGASVAVVHADDGRLAGSIAPFGARARAVTARHILTLDETAIDALRRDGRLTFKFRIEGGTGKSSARVLGAAIRVERSGG